MVRGGLWIFKSAIITKYLIRKSPNLIIIIIIIMVIFKCYFSGELIALT